MENKKLPDKNVIGKRPESPLKYPNYLKNITKKIDKEIKLSHKYEYVFMICGLKRARQIIREETRL